MGTRQFQTAAAITEYAVLNADGLEIATRVSVAGTSALRRKGLLGIDSLAGGRGLWIAPCEAVHTFGMGFPIDVVFLDREFRIKRLITGLRSRRIAVCASASSVLELGAGAIEQTGIRVGDRLVFRRL